MEGVQVWIEEFSQSQESRRRVAAFKSRAEALAAARARIEDGLREFVADGLSAREVFRQWRIFGEDVFVVPDDPGDSFSATDYARLRVGDLTGDHSRPVTVEAVCTDRLNTASGMPSAPGRWAFWIAAPAPYAGAIDSLRRAVEAKYAEMSRKTLASEGSSYTLLNLELRELTPDEAAEGLREKPDRQVLTLMPDGHLGKLS